jgi:hypothetical protein
MDLLLLLQFLNHPHRLWLFNHQHWQFMLMKVHQESAMAKVGYDVQPYGKEEAKKKYFLTVTCVCHFKTEGYKKWGRVRSTLSDSQPSRASVSIHGI